MNANTNVIIRLQKLPWTATSADIREFFRGLNIPDGGVHIIGGRDGDAFIAFASDEDARQAMRLDGKRIKDAKIKLFLSSRLEMQQVIDKARQELQQQQLQQQQQQQQQQQMQQQMHTSAMGGGGGGGYAGGLRDRKRRRSRSRSRSNERYFPGVDPRARSPLGDRSRRGNDVLVPMSRQSPISMADSGTGSMGGYRDQVYQQNRGFDGGRPGVGVRGQYQSSTSSTYDNGQTPYQQPQQQPPTMAGRAKNAGRLTQLEPRGQPMGHQQTSQNAVHGQQPVSRSGGLYGGEQQQQQQQPTSDGYLQQQRQLPQRNSRRALLPAPEEQDGYQAQTDIGPDIQQQHVHRPSTNYDSHHGQQQQRPVVDDWQDERVEPVAHSVYGHQQSHGRPALLAAPPSESMMGGGGGFDSGLCVVMSNVPPALQRYGAVREFFHPLDLEGPDKIKIGVDERGERTGLVYCKFLVVKDAEMALSYRGQQNVYIRTCNDVEFRNAIDGGLQPRPRRRSRDRDIDAGPGKAPHTREEFGSRHRQPIISTGGESVTDNGPWDVQDGCYVIEITNIPYKADGAALRSLMGRYEPKEIRRLYKYHSVTGRVVTSDTAFVILTNETNANAAMKANGRFLMDREVKALRSSVREMERVFAKAPAPPIGEEDNDRRDSWRDRPRYGNDRRSNSAGSGSRTDRSPPQSMDSNTELATTQSIAAPIVADQSNLPSTPSVASQPAFTLTCVRLNGVAMNAYNRDVASLFADLNVVPNGIRVLKSPAGVAYVEFASPEDCQAALAKDRTYMGVQMISVTACSKEEMMEAVQRQFGGGLAAGMAGSNGNGNSNLESSNSPPSNIGKALLSTPVATISPANNGLPTMEVSQIPTESEELVEPTMVNGTGQRTVQATPNSVLISIEQSPLLTDDRMTAQTQLELGTDEAMPSIDPEVVHTIGMPGCVAALHNLPPGITLEEICQLFQGYQLIDDSVRMHYNNGGVPTGDCLLAFASPSNATAAVAAVDGTELDQQIIRMYVVPA